MYTLRTRFKNEIIAEFLPPSRKLKKQRVVILLSGAPSVPSKSFLMEYLSKKNFWVFFPRYRGSWESDGKFLAKSPHQDLIDVVEGIQSGFKDLWSGNKYKLKPDQIIVVGSSFAGPAALLASKNPDINKIMLFSPVIDWRKPGKDEPLGFLERFMKEAFGQGYRMTKTGLNKLKSGKFYNPATASSQIEASKLLLIHARDDTVTPYKSTADFAKTTQTKLVTLPKGGHLGTSLLLTSRFYNYFKKFIDS